MQKNFSCQEKILFQGFSWEIAREQLNILSNFFYNILMQPSTFNVMCKKTGCSHCPLSEFLTPPPPKNPPKYKYTPPISSLIVRRILN